MKISIGPGEGQLQGVDMDMTQWIRTITSNRSKCTASTYIRHVKALIALVGKRSPRTITAQDVQQYLNDLKPSAQRTALAAVNSYLKTADRSITLDKLALKQVPQPRLIQALTDEEVRQVLGCINNEERRLLALVLFETGLRVSTICRLTVDNLHLNGEIPYIEVVELKRLTKATPPLTSTTADLLKEWNDRQGHGPQDRVFPTSNRTNIWDCLSTAGRKAGITKEVYPHLFRHGRAQKDTEAGTPLPVVLQARGWARPDFFTKRYGQPSVSISVGLAAKGLIALPDAAQPAAPAAPPPPDGSKDNQELARLRAQGLISEEALLKLWHRSEPEEKLKKSPPDIAFR